MESKNREGLISSLVEDVIKIKEAVQCSICHSSLSLPTRSPACDHIFCKICFEQLFSNDGTKPKCPVCNTSLPVRRALRSSKKLAEVVNEAKSLTKTFGEEISNMSKRARKRRVEIPMDKSNAPAVEESSGPTDSVVILSTSTPRATMTRSGKTRQVLPRTKESKSAGFTAMRMKDQEKMPVDSEPNELLDESIGSGGFAASLESIPTYLMTKVTEFAPPQEYFTEAIMSNIGKTRSGVVQHCFKKLIEVSAIFPPVEFSVPPDYKDTVEALRNRPVNETPPKERYGLNRFRNYRIPKKSRPSASDVAASEKNTEFGGLTTETGSAWLESMPPHNQFSAPSDVTTKSKAVSVISDQQIFTATATNRSVDIFDAFISNALLATTVQGSTTGKQDREVSGRQANTISRHDSMEFLDFTQKIAGSTIDARFVATGTEVATVAALPSGGPIVKRVSSGYWEPLRRKSGENFERVRLQSDSNPTEEAEPSQDHGLFQTQPLPGRKGRPPIELAPDTEAIVSEEIKDVDDEYLVQDGQEAAEECPTVVPDSELLMQSMDLSIEEEVEAGDVSSELLPIDEEVEPDHRSPELLPIQENVDPNHRSPELLPIEKDVESDNRSPELLPIQEEVADHRSPELFAGVASRAMDNSLETENSFITPAAGAVLESEANDRVLPSTDETISMEQEDVEETGQRSPELFKGVESRAMDDSIEVEKSFTAPATGAVSGFEADEHGLPSTEEPVVMEHVQICDVNTRSNTLEFESVATFVDDVGSESHTLAIDEDGLKANFIEPKAEPIPDTLILCSNAQSPIANEAETEALMLDMTQKAMDDILFLAAPVSTTPVSQTNFPVEAEGHPRDETRPSSVEREISIKTDEDVEDLSQLLRSKIRLGKVVIVQMHYVDESNRHEQVIRTSDEDETDYSGACVQLHQEPTAEPVVASYVAGRLVNVIPGHSPQLKGTAAAIDRNLEESMPVESESVRSEAVSGYTASYETETTVGSYVTKPLNEDNDSHMDIPDTLILDNSETNQKPAQDDDAGTKDSQNPVYDGNADVGQEWVSQAVVDKPEADVIPKTSASTSQATMSQSSSQAESPFLVPGDHMFLSPQHSGQIVFYVTGLSLKPWILQRFADLVNAKYTEEFSSEVTHVIVKSERDDSGRYLCKRRTIGYFRGIAERKWVVSHDWVYTSVRYDRLCDPSVFEIQGDVANKVTMAPLKARLSEKPLMGNVSVYFHGLFPHEMPKKDDGEALTLALGGIIHDTVDDLKREAAENPERLCVILAENVSEYPDSESQVQTAKELHDELYYLHRLPVVSVTWLLVCIEEWKQVCHDNYKLNVTNVFL